MSHLPPLHVLFKNEVDRYIDILTKSYPKHGSRTPLSWTMASWELQVSEMTVRNYIDGGKLKSLKIVSIAEFIVMEDIKERIAEDKKRAKENR